jgi:hypothetical protein
MLLAAKTRSLTALNSAYGNINLHLNCPGNLLSAHMTPSTMQLPPWTERQLLVFLLCFVYSYRTNLRVRLERSGSTPEQQIFWFVPCQAKVL